MNTHLRHPCYTLRTRRGHAVTLAFHGSSLGFLLAGVAVLLLLYFGYRVAGDLAAAYFPYEGRVEAITPIRLDWFVFETPDNVYLHLRTPAGAQLKRAISRQTQVIQRIEVGDYVIKKRGFFDTVRPRDKATTEELRQQARERLGR